MTAKKMILRSVVLLGALAAPVAALAIPVTYTVSGVASGVLGASTFSNSLVTLSFTGDTSNVIFGNGGDLASNSVGASTVTVAGVGSAIFANGTVRVDDIHSFPGVAFFDPVTFFAFGTSGSTFSTYSLQTYLGPILGNSITNGTQVEATSVGKFFLTSVGTSTTFTAAAPVTAVTPEPGTLTLLSTGVLTLVGIARRKLVRV